MDENLKRTLIYVRRQIGGDKDPNLFRNIIGALRSYTHGIASMKEIADFYAHREGKTKGVVTDHCKIFFDHLHFKIMQMRLGSAGPDFPLSLKSITQYVLNNLDGKEVYAHLKFGKKEAARLLESALDKTEERDGKLHFVKPIEKSEMEVFEFALSWVIVRTAFDSKTIIKDYIRLLSANRLIVDADKPKLMLLENDLALHLLETMHRMTLRIDEKFSALLSVHIDQHGKLSITALGEYRDADGNHTSAHAHVLLTDLSANDFISGEYFMDHSLSALDERKFEIGMSYDQNAPLGGPYPKTYTITDFVEIKDGKLAPLV